MAPNLASSSSAKKGGLHRKSLFNAAVRFMTLRALVLVSDCLCSLEAALEECRRLDVEVAVSVLDEAMGAVA